MYGISEGDWRYAHYRVICSFMEYINYCNTRVVKDKFVLKGGTSLMLCYGLSRFSENIDLDCVNPTGNIWVIVDNFCKTNGYSFRKAKDTDTVKRAFIHYGSNKPLKVEVSYRRKFIGTNEVNIINNILVYSISRLLSMKLDAFKSRTKIRDLYDVVFIVLNFWKSLNDQDKLYVIDAFSYRDLSYVSFLLEEQTDDLINKESLTDGVLKMYSLIGYTR